MPADLFYSESNGVVGDRQLVAVQAVDLGRLHPRPVPIVPSAINAVSGMGPKGDSNGIGKTTLLAAVSLLLGDPEWKLHRGAPDARGLLFGREAAGATRLDSADTGFVFGVFSGPAGEDVTVAIRISSEAQTFMARWMPGRWFALGDTLAEIRTLAQTLWADMGASSEVGPKTYCDRMFKSSGRCLAYLSQRGSNRTDRSLMMLSQYIPPDGLGEALIGLLGLGDLLEGERDERAKLSLLEADLADKIKSAADDEAARSALRKEVSKRTGARSALAEGQSLWRRRTARKVLDVRHEHAELGEKITDAENAAKAAADAVAAAEADLAELADVAVLAEEEAAAARAHAAAGEARSAAERAHAVAVEHESQLRNDLRRLAEAAEAAPPGLTAAAAAAAEAKAETEVADARRAEGAAVAAVGQAAARLAAIREHGTVDPAAVAALDGIGANPVALLDGIAVKDRDRWEALLAPWRGALLVDGDLAAAAAVVPAGTALVARSGGEGGPPAGVTAAPGGAAVFLTVLAGRADGGMTDRDLGVVVAGGFDSPICGRDAAVADAEAGHAAADAALVSARAEAAAADAELVAARADVAAVAAVAQHAELATQAKDARVAAQAAGEARDAAVAVAAEVEEAYWTARSQHADAAKERDRRTAEADRARSHQTEMESAVKDLRRQQAGLHLGDWEQAWMDCAGLGDPEPEEALAGDARSENRIREEANERLKHAFSLMGMFDPATSRYVADAAPNDDIADRIRGRTGSLLDDDDDLAGPTAQDRRFDTVAGPFQTYLDVTDAADRDLLERLDAERADQERVLAATRAGCEGQREALRVHRDNVEADIEMGLTRVAGHFTGLDAEAGGYGADMVWESVKPQGAEDKWVWQVTPRWKRSPDGNMTPYNTAANSAQEKMFRIYLVLATLLASDDAHNQTLVVDEAGDSFGKEHLRDVVAALAKAAEQKGITVLTAFQEPVLRTLAGRGHETLRSLLWIERPDDREPLCFPIRVLGYDSDGARVEANRAWLENLTGGYAGRDEPAA